eukprot:7754421-Ditylum_brightwellii.AAC.1
MQQTSPRLRMGNADSTRLQDLGTTLNIQDNLANISETTKRLHSARKVLRTSQENAAHLRDAFLEIMAQMYTTSGNTNIALILKNLQHCKEVWISFSLLRFAARGEVAGYISTIKIPEPIQPNSAVYPDTISSLNFQTHWKEIDDLDEGPLKDYIGDYGLGKGATEIIEGNFDPNKSENIPA